MSIPDREGMMGEGVDWGLWPQLIKVCPQQTVVYRWWGRALTGAFGRSKLKLTTTNCDLGMVGVKSYCGLMAAAN